MEGDIGPTATAILDTQKEEEAGTDREVAVSQSLPAASATGDDVSLYQLKWVEWKGGYAPIITQNENGPCPLLALCNVLILSGKMKIPPGETIVSSTYLLDLLGACILENDPEELSNGERANYEQNVQDAMAVFPKLQTGLDVNVKFNSVSGFEFTSESGLFDILGIHLYHGWLADPQDTDTWEVVGQCTYNNLTEKIINDGASSDPAKLHDALIAEQFLESTATQLTYYGLCELNTVVQEGELCVFFRNNHFCTLFKRKGHLLLLVTDHGFLNEHGHVWEVLSNIEGDGDFLDATFHWSSHSDLQQKREERAGQKLEGGEEEGEKEEEEAPRQPPADTNLDYETALSLQQEEYGYERRQQPQALAPAAGGLSTPEQRLMTDQALAAQLQQEELPPNERGPPPSSREEYERAAAMDQRRRREDSCTVL